LASAARPDERTTSPRSLSNVWRDNSPGRNILFGQWSSPTIIEINGRAQCVAPHGDGWVRSFDALTGEPLWQFDMNRKESRWDLGRRDRRIIRSSPVFADNRIYLASGPDPMFGSGSGRLVCLDPTRRGDISTELAIDAAGKAIPQRRIQAVDPQANEKAVANPNSGLVWEFTHAGDGKEFTDVMDGTVSNVAVHNGLVIAAAFSGLVHCLDAKTGRRYWVHDGMPNAGIYASPLIVDDKVYLADDDGKVSVLGLSRDPNVALRKRNGWYEPLHQIQMDHPIYCSPVFANGVLYVATQKELYAISGGKAAEPKAAARARGASPSNLIRENRTARGVFVPTPHDVVKQMLVLAGVKKSDIVYDLGSGDGRIVIAAAKDYGCQAIGYELDPELVALSRQQTKTVSVEQLVTIHMADVFTADLTPADVVTLYLLPQQNEKLVPQLKRLKWGSRVVSHLFEIPGMKLEKRVTVESKESGEKHTLFLYLAPFR
jgi:outer membrane protein assembly factor BamB